jgi:acyl carrier protein
LRQETEKELCTIGIRGPRKIMDQLIKIIQRYTGLPEEVIREDANLVEDLKIDSITMYEIFITIEMEYEIEEVPREVVIEISTVGDLRAVIEKHTIAI